MNDAWSRFVRFRAAAETVGLTVDASRMGFDDAWFAGMAEPFTRAFAEMRALESGAIANADENRQVGHYWLRTPSLAPTVELKHEIESSIAAVKRFAADVHSAKIKPPRAAKFTQVIAVGIGGSALGPQFVADALGHPSTDRMRLRFIDNTDPDGIARTLAETGDLAATLCLVTSKSGGTAETRNGMRMLEAAYRVSGLDFARHAVAITMPGSLLDRQAQSESWLARFAMFDWVGGRTSQLSAVGLLPAAMQGFDIDAMLAGASACDAATRVEDMRRNPAALLAAAWHFAGDAHGRRDMVVLPYKDRLALLGRYLQQLVMESLGKRLDRDGRVVEQGLTVYGNKGSTDQHAYMQQLRDGIDNFFAVFVRVLESGGDETRIESGITAGDYLHGFLLGTREALAQNNRRSITITLPRVDAASVGALIALFERAVGLYASLINVNAYHQPGVEAGKKAASAVLALQGRIVAALDAAPRNAEQIAIAIGTDDIETVYLLLEHLAANGRARVHARGAPETMTFVRG